MKTQESIAAQMDEIVFEHRNKNYGAYILRKMYKKQLTRALFIASAVMIAGLAYPLVLSYRDINNGIVITDPGPTGVFTGNHPPVDPPVVPPPPPSIDEVKKHISFSPPIVVDGEVPEGEGLPDMGYITNTPIIPVDIAEEPVGIKKDDVIEIKAEDPPKLFAEEMPSFVGGDVERLKFLTDNIKYPQLAEENGIKGTVYVQFVVDIKGNITDVKIMRGIGGGCDEEALRVIKMMPQWHPGKQNGKTVRVLFTMPVVFKLQS